MVESRPQTLPEALAHAAEVNLGGLRFLDRSERETMLGWPEIRRRARIVAAGLQALGIERGECVGLIFPTGPEFIAAFFGCHLAGAVPVPLYPPVRFGRLAEYHRQTSTMLRAADARLVLADRLVRRVLGETVELAGLELGCRTLGDLPTAELRKVRIEPSDLGLVQFSSGTTVDPKPVALSHRALLAQTRILNRLWPEVSDERPTGVTWLPLYHDMGLIGCILPALDLPSEMTLIGPEVFVARPAIWLRALSRYRAMISPAPNFAYGLCTTKVRDEEMDGVDLSHWRVALNGAEPVAPGVLRAFQERFARWGFRPEALTPVYGLSEAALAVTFSELGRPFTARRFDRDELASRGVGRESDAGLELVSVGKPVPEFAIELRSATGDRLPEGAVGRVWARGPSLMEGYLGRPEATAAALREGWLDTGDLGFLCRGELYLTGRAKDVLILRGRNYAPEGVEHAADGLPGARLGCVVAASWMPEGAETEHLALFLEHAKEASPDEMARLPEAARAAVLATTGLNVDEVVVLAAGTLPRTSSGKLRRAETLRRHLDSTLAPPEPVTPLRIAGAVARSSLAFARARLRRVAGGTGKP